MDAFVRNRCEKEVLFTIKEISKILGLDITIDTEAHAEGGLKDFWKLIGKNDKQIMVVLTILILYFSIFPRTNQEIQDLQKENLELQNQEIRLNLERAKKEMQQEGGSIDEETIRKTISYFESSFKLNKHKSNFFQHLLAYSKVTSVESRVLDNNFQPIGKTVTVDRATFPRYILVSDEIPTAPIENAIVDIVSPVLNNGRYRWKGLYQGKPIEFLMKDEEYKQSVVRKEVSFQNGYAIECVLNHSRRVNDEGEIENYNFIVSTVLKNFERDQGVETPQGKRYRRQRELEKTQLNFNDELMS
jgi:hypothetical protein